MKDMAMNNKSCFLLVVKDDHKYFFKYNSGEEKNLFMVLIQYGKDSELNISLIEVLHLIRKISGHLRDKGHLESAVFHVDPDEIEE